MKLIIDNSMTPIESARLKYYRLYERQAIAKSEEPKQKSLLTKLFEFING